MYEMENNYSPLIGVLTGSITMKTSEEMQITKRKTRNNTATQISYPTSVNISKGLIFHNRNAYTPCLGLLYSQ